jgi:hypothetical protein
MSEHLRPTPSCEDFEGSLTEMALGSLPGNERTIVLAHLDHCPHCRARLEELAGVADALVEAAPGHEPPVGFEVGLFQRLGIDPASARLRRRSRRANRTLRVALAVAAGVAALSLAFGSGWLTAPSSAGRRPAPSAVAPEGLTSARLMSSGHETGRVMLYEGSPSWIFMTVQDAPSSGWVSCEVVTTHGTKLVVGTFWLHSGYGAWGSSLPVAASDVGSTKVMRPDGAIVASAQMRT